MDVLSECPYSFVCACVSFTEFTYGSLCAVPRDFETTLTY